ncbi:MAG: zinc metallopeptidase [Oscillospiraceae bacterium]|nr:zinc metallopeptidase [Oscillospiraceae bacterium]
MPYYGYGLDIYYLLLVLPAFALAMWAQIHVKRTYKKMDAVLNSRGLTGEQAAMRVLYHYGINNVRIERAAGRLTDHYDPRSNVIRLSGAVFSGTSVAAVGIACHEAGHAAQHAQSYAPVKVRNSILPVSNIGSMMGIPLAIAGLFMGFGMLFYIGIALFLFAIVFQLVTLPVEFNASKRALAVIDETGMLQGGEYDGAKKVLSAAAWTYVAALAVSIANLLRLLLLSNRGKRR